MSASWGSTISITIVLAALPPARASFGTLLFLVDKADGNTLNGERVVTYESASDAEDDNTAGYISDDTLAAVQVAFSQIPTPSSVKVGNQDTGASETLSAAITAIRAADDDWYCLCMYSRVAADIAAVATVIETTNSDEASQKIAVFQSADADWLTSGLPAGLTGLAAKERVAVVYHDDDTEYADIAWAASRLVFDPDVQSAPWEGQLRSVAALTTGLTAAQRNFVAANNANVALPFSSADQYLSPGVNCNGRAFYEIVSADWLTARIREDFALLKLQHTARGEKLTVDYRGQTKGLAILNGRLQQGEAAGHFEPEQWRATAYAITASDLSTRKLRFKVEAMVAGDARLFDFNVYLQQTELQAS